MQVEIAIESYDDLFSDFDIRKYTERYFSNDFLNELSMRTCKLLSEKKLDIKLIIPEKARNIDIERVIAKRLKEFFLCRLERNKKKTKDIVLNSVLLEGIGLIFFLSANFLSNFITEYLKDFLLIPSWFFIWNGLEKFFANRKALKRKVTYYTVLHNAIIRFEGIQ